MVHFLTGLVPIALAAGLAAVAADDPPQKLTPEERKALKTRWNELTLGSARLYQATKYLEAQKSLEDALAVARRLYPAGEFPDGHADLAESMNNLAFLYNVLGNTADAEKLYKDALGMRRRLFKGDHPDLAQSMNNLAFLYRDQGKPAEAESLLKETLEMSRRLYKGDHLRLVLAMGNLAFLYQVQGKLADAEVLYRESLEMSRRLFKGDHPDLALALSSLGALYQVQGRLTDAALLFKDALEMRRRLFRRDHPDLATSLNNLATIYQDQGRVAEAEAHCREALEMRRRLFKGDHRTVADSLNSLAGLSRAQGRLTDAVPLYKDALEMRRRLFKGDHPDVATSLNNLGALYHAQGKLADAEALLKDALEMRRRLVKGDHPALATSLNNLAGLYQDQEKLADAKLLLEEVLAMHRRLFKGDHPDVAVSLNNLAVVCLAQGKLADAEARLGEALAMHQRLFKGDHPDLGRVLSNLAFANHAQGKLADAESRFRDTLAQWRRLVATFASHKAEGETLTLLASFPVCRDGFLSVTRQRGAAAEAVYPEVWADKASVARTYEQRQQAARAAAADPKAAKLLSELCDARRLRAELIFAPSVPDPATRNKREQDIQALDRKIAELDRTVRPLLPAIDRAERLAKATPAELQRVLPPGAAVVDYLRYTYFEYDADKPGRDGRKRTDRYLAFVVTSDVIGWADLGAAHPIEAAVNRWREAILSGKEIPATIPTAVRELVWVKVRRELPAGVKTVYISPDLALCRVPWAALPGDKAGTILLEDYAVATIPHGTFLLDHLWPRKGRMDPPDRLLVVGGVDYQAETRPDLPVTRDLPVKPGAQVAWSPLPGAAGEAAGVAAAGTKKKLVVTPLRAEKATTAAVLAELPTARYAHLATHGFFADPSFRSVFQVDPKHFEMTMRGERVGAGALSPLVMTGLVLAGANHPNTPGRGIVTGESLIDLDLSGLELAVLSACETGLGDVAGGEGTFGLQRAFHLAGTRNVVASLWKVPDEPTSALMGLFYRNLWEKNLSPVEALRQAQLELYRNPDKITALANSFRGKLEVVPGADAGVKIGADGKAHPLQWAAFTLSGPGR